MNTLHFMWFFHVFFCCKGLVWCKPVEKKDCLRGNLPITTLRGSGESGLASSDYPQGVARGPTMDVPWTGDFWIALALLR